MYKHDDDRKLTCKYLNLTVFYTSLFPDGFSRQVLWLEAAWITNKNPKVTAKFFLDYVEKRNGKFKSLIHFMFT